MASLVVEAIGGDAAKELGIKAAAVPAADDEAHPGSRPSGLSAAREGGPDKLTRIKGVGPVNEKKLNGLGIWHFDQVASWKKAEVEWVGSYLAFPGRIEREEWVKQAKTLAKSSKGKTGGAK